MQLCESIFVSRLSVVVPFEFSGLARKPARNDKTVRFFQTILLADFLTTGRDGGRRSALGRSLPRQQINPLLPSAWRGLSCRRYILPAAARGTRLPGPVNGSGHR